jgi:hypothetical protein
MQIAVIVLNILSSLASLATVWFGWMITLVGQLSPTHTDYTAIAFGGVLIAAFLIIPPVCVVASTKLARQDRRSSILVSLAPVMLIGLAIIVALVGHLPPVR